MKRDTDLTPGQALEAGVKMPYALVRTLSSVTLGKTPEREALEALWEELLEVRFFGGTEECTEIRLFRYNGALHAARLTEEPGDHKLEKKQSLLNPRFGKSITVHHILESDPDGQIHRAAAILADWEEEKS